MSLTKASAKLKKVLLILVAIDTSDLRAFKSKLVSSTTTRVLSVPLTILPVTEYSTRLSESLCNVNSVASKVDTSTVSLNIRVMYSLLRLNLALIRVGRLLSGI